MFKLIYFHHEIQTKLFVRQLSTHILDHLKRVTGSNRHFACCLRMRKVVYHRSDHTDVLESAMVLLQEEETCLKSLERVQFQRAFPSPFAWTSLWLRGQTQEMLNWQKDLLGGRQQKTQGRLWFVSSYVWGRKKFKIVQNGSIKSNLKDSTYNGA